VSAAVGKFVVWGVASVPLRPPWWLRRSKIIISIGVPNTACTLPPTT
jgi:hypothetical protein